MIEYKVTIRSKRPKWLARSSFNDMMRQALSAAGELWITKYLPMHFGNAAVSRYGYNFRSGTWHAIKNALEAAGYRPARDDESLMGRSDARVIRMGHFKVWAVPGHFENEILYWHGDMKKMVLGNAASGTTASRMHVTATENKYRLKIPVAIPHPIQPKFKGEITRRTKNETKDMSRTIMSTLKRLFGLNVDTTVERVTP